MIQHATSTMTHLQMLTVDIGARPAGSPTHHRAEAYIREQFQSAGLSIEDVTVDFPDWSLINAKLTHHGMPLAVDVNPFSPPCEVTAPTVALSTLPELEAAQLDGKIALLYGDLSKAPIFPINFEQVQFERDQTINRLLLDRQPVAILAVNLDANRRVHIFEDEDFPIPSATINVDVGRTLLEHVGDDVHLMIETTTEASHATTLVGRTSGDDTHRIVLCAHYDTKIGTPGAHDNGAGVASLLSLAEALPQLDLPVGLEFVAWGDEEYGAHTDGVYVRRFADHFPNMVCAINMDGLGPLMECTTLTMLSHSEAFEHDICQLLVDYPRVVWVEPWVQSNHFTYFSRGVPTFAIGSLTWGRAHQADDTIDYIGVDKLEEVTTLATDIVRRAQSQDPARLRP